MATNRDDALIRLTAPRGGRKRSPDQTLSLDDRVRVEFRMPAATAARLFAIAMTNRRSVNRTGIDLLIYAMDALGTNPPETPPA